MTAVAEPPVTVEDLFVESLFDGFSLKRLYAQDEVVADRRARFYHNLRLQVELHDTEPFQWFGLFKDDVAHLVGAFVFRHDRSIEVTDLYPAPTRVGVDAGYVALKLLKVLVDRKIIPYWIGGIVESNAFGHRHVEKYFRIRPRSRVYVYAGEEF